jgi:hypothetical protein
MLFNVLGCLLLDNGLLDSLENLFGLSQRHAKVAKVVDWLIESDNLFDYFLVAARIDRYLDFESHGSPSLSVEFSRIVRGESRAVATGPANTGNALILPYPPRELVFHQKV